MALTGTTNTAANTALRYLSINNSNASGSLAKLASGSRIVKASDDAASLAIGTKLKADVTSLKQARSMPVRRPRCCRWPTAAWPASATSCSG